MSSSARGLLAQVLDHGRAVVAAGVLLLSTGIVVLEQIPREAEPDITLGIFHLTLSTEQLSPDDGDRLVARPLARALRGMEGLDHIRTISRANAVQIEIEFDPEFDPERARSILLERLEPARAKLPGGVSLPRVRQVNLSTLPLTAVTIAGDLAPVELMRRARELRDALERADEVREAILIGERKTLIEVVLDPVKLDAYQLDSQTLARVIRAANQVVPSGRSDSPRSHLALAVPGLLDSPQSLARLPVKVAGDGIVRLGELALVRRTLSDPSSLARVDGTPALAIEITKHPGVNVFDALEAMRETVERTTAKWPTAIEIDYARDASQRIRTRSGELTNALAGAVILVLAIVVAALGPRAGLLVGLAIPGSFLLATIALALGGVSINTAVLYAFVMSVGLLVDGAIVVVEHAERAISSGSSRAEAYRASATHLAGPVTASTLTTLAAFVPLLFWPGIIGEYLYFLPLTVLATLSASLLMALVFVPVLGRLGLGPRASERTSTEGTSRSVLPCELGPRGSDSHGTYPRVLAMALTSPGIVVALGIAALVASLWAFERFGQGVEHLADIEPLGAEIHIHAAGLPALADQAQIAREVEQVVRAHLAVASVFTIIGERAARASDGGDVVATLYVDLVPWHARPNGHVVLDELKVRTAHIPGVVVEVRPLGEGPSARRAIELDVTGLDPPNLQRTVRLAHAALAKIPGVVRVQDSRPAQRLNWSVEVDRTEAARLGLDLEHIGRYAQLITSGHEVATVRRPGREDEDFEVRVRLPERYRSLEGFSATRIWHDERAIPIEQVARLEAQVARGTVERLDGQLTRRIVADIEPGLAKDHRLSDILRRVEAWAHGTALAPGTSVQRRGADDDPQDTRDFLLWAFTGALLLITIVLLVQFKSLYDTALVLFAVVTAIAGVLVGLLVIDRPFSIVLSGIGIIALSGIVVNNNIILVASYRAGRVTGLGAYEAVMNAAQSRLRPVVLTTVTTVAGLTPLILGLDIDLAERQIAAGAPSGAYWVQMSAAIAFGLLFATALTLFVTPAALLLRARLDAARARFAQAERVHGTPESIAAVFEAHGTAVGFAALTAIVAAWIFIPQLVAVRITDIFSKQIFEQPPSRWFQALESAGFWSLIVLGAGYAYWKDAHVRVDIVRERLSARGRAWVEIFGFVLLLGPTAAVVLLAGWDLVLRSYLDDEISGALLGSPTRWIFKAMMLLCFFQLLWLGGYVTWRNIRFLAGREAHPYPPNPVGSSPLGPERDRDIGTSSNPSTPS